MSAIIRVIISHKEMEIEPGREGELSVTVQNLSEIVDQFDVDIEGIDPAWVTISPPQLSLFPQDQGEAVIRLHPPESAPAGTVDFAVKVVSRENSLERTRIEGSLVVEPLLLFDVTLSPQRQSTVGEEAAFAVRLKNPGNVDVALRLSASDPEEGCTYRFDANPVTLEPGENREILLTVIPGQSAPDQRKLYPITVTATPVDAPGKARRATGQLECLPEVVSLELGLWPRRRSAVGSGRFRVQLDNVGNTDLRLTLEGADAADACAFKFDPAELTLAAGESRQAALTVAPFGELPMDEPRVYDFTIRAVPGEAPHRAAEVSGQFECRPGVVLFDLDLLPPRISAKRGGIFQVQLSNRGDRPLQLYLSASGSGLPCDFAFQSREVTLGIRESKETGLKVIRKASPPAGDARVCKFSVEAVPEGAEQLGKSVEGELEIRRPKSRRGCLITAALVLGLGICLLTIVVVLLLVYANWDVRISQFL